MMTTRADLKFHVDNTGEWLAGDNLDRFQAETIQLTVVRTRLQKRTLCHTNNADHSTGSVYNWLEQYTKTLHYGDISRGQFVCGLKSLCRPIRKRHFWER